MKYDLRDIRESGLKVSRRLGGEQVRALLVPVGVETPENAEDVGSVDVELELSPVNTGTGEGAVNVRGMIQGFFTVSCARCLGSARVGVEEPDLNLTFLPPAKVGDGREELSQEDLDTFVHDGTHIDLEPVVREQLVLAIPITPLCGDDCKGICTICGADLNRDRCSCEQAPQPATPWAEALAKLKDKPNAPG